MFENQKKQNILLVGGMLLILLLGLWMWIWNASSISSIETELDEMAETFGGLGGVKAQPFLVVTDGGSTPATTTQFIGSILPNETNRHSLGSSALYWLRAHVKNVFATSALVDTLTVGSGGCSGCPGVTLPLGQHLTFSANNTYDIAASTGSARNTFTSGTAYIGTAILPYNSNLVDIGSLAFGFRDVFSSGTVYLGTAITPAQTGVVTAGSDSFRFLSGYFNGLFASTTVHGGNFVLGTGGRIYKSGGTAQITTTSTLNFVLQAATGTNMAYNDYIRVPTACTIGAVYLMASSTPVAGDATIVDVNTHATMGAATTTIFTDQSKRPSLIATGLVTTGTVPDVTSLSAGTILTVDVDQFRNHGGMQLQVECAKPLF